MRVALVTTVQAVLGATSRISFAYEVARRFLLATAGTDSRPRTHYVMKDVKRSCEFACEAK